MKKKLGDKLKKYRIKQENDKNKKKTKSNQNNKNQIIYEK
jgi:hypothetical protein